MRRARSLLSLALVLGLVCAGHEARAHGGLPIAQSILFEGDTLIVPTRFWGVFLGPSLGTGQWRWICEEAINQQQARVWAYGRSGAFHVTDFAGITSSRDGGCTWVQSTGEIQQRSTSFVLADPVARSRAFATTDQGGTVPWNALFESDDDGATWAVASKDLQVDEFLRGVAVSADGKRLFVTGTPRSGMDRTTRLHVSTDGGASFTSVPVTFQLCDGTPPTCFTPDKILPVAVDPSEPDRLYLRVEASTLMVLLSARGDGTTSELLRMPTEAMKPGLGGMEFLPEQKAVLVATGQGPYRSIGGGPFEKVGNLSRGECLTRHGDSLYACGWNFAPDSMAIARGPLSDVSGGALTFQKVFNYDETCGPVTTCAPTTPVGMICPGIWKQYGPSLGATGEACGGGDAGMEGTGGGGCSCDIVPSGTFRNSRWPRQPRGCGGGDGKPGGGNPVFLGGALMALFGGLGFRQRRRRLRARATGSDGR